MLQLLDYSVFRKNALTHNVTPSFNQGSLKKLGLKVGGGGGGVKGEIWKIVGISFTLP